MRQLYSYTPPRLRCRLATALYPIPTQRQWETRLAAIKELSLNETRTITPLEYTRATGAPAGGALPSLGGIELTAWLKIAVVSLLLLATFRFNVLRLWLKTNPFTGEANWRHAIFIPLVGLYYLYVNRDDLLEAGVRHSWSGLGILLAGLLIFTYGIYPGQNDFVKDIGMVLSIFGTVLMLSGWQVMKVAWFPIAFLLCAVPWPDQLYSNVASPLQHLAASISVGVLRLTGVDAYNFGTKVTYLGNNGEPRTLNVAEACAGLRSLMTFVSVGAAVAFLSLRPMWQKTALVAMTVPIAVFCNVGRVAGQGLIDRYVSQQWSEGFAHQFVGIFMLLPGFLLVLATGWALDRLFIEGGIPRRYGGPAQPGYQPLPGAGANWKLHSPARTYKQNRRAVPTPVAAMRPPQKPKTALGQAVAPGRATSMAPGKKSATPQVAAGNGAGALVNPGGGIPPMSKPAAPPPGLLSIASASDAPKQNSRTPVENPPLRSK